MALARLDALEARVRCLEVTLAAVDSKVDRNHQEHLTAAHRFRTDLDSIRKGAEV
ncbi:hypothetical protein [Kitasatospora purpeofusca]|uniref:hypothetical protein n=1 Tax=Kitasatospora purpeofusca TaxID=67352 RepID=UPI002258D696|nr:hypothetical protein [Kitasatospora purpeofusca]MCX4755146.1 hypothetical protein [Kitasatospora purpeofusca]WSR36964.1 hypothetical protein OG715_41980 [Kitasatospora purpeofusca]WSR37681.1 hypothetical protein OG196_00400 [Kitasatospora purpeofusca]